MDKEHSSAVVETLSTFEAIVHGYGAIGRSEFLAAGYTANRATGLAVAMAAAALVEATLRHPEWAQAIVAPLRRNEEFGHSADELVENFPIEAWA